MTTTIEQFLQMNPDYQRLTLTAIFDLANNVQEELSGVKTFNKDIRDLYEDIEKLQDEKEEIEEAKSAKVIDWETARYKLASINLKLTKSYRDLKQICKDRLPLLDAAFSFAESLQKICTDPKKYAEYARRLELNE